MSRNKKAAIITAIICAIGLSIIGYAVAYQQEQHPLNLPGDAEAGVKIRRFGSGLLGASGTFVTTVTKGAYQSPASVYFGTISNSFTSSAESLLQQSLNASTSSAPMVSASSGTLQMLYAYSTSLDGTLNICNNLAGTGARVTGVNMVAGVPYSWDYLTSGVTTTLNLTAGSSCVFVAGATANGGTTSATSTNITAVGLYP